MTKYEWFTELKKNIHRLPADEVKRVVEYYDELFADYIERGKGEMEITAEFGNPSDVADKIMSEYEGMPAPPPPIPAEPSNDPYGTPPVPTSTRPHIPDQVASQSSMPHTPPVPPVYGSAPYTPPASNDPYYPPPQKNSYLPDADEIFSGVPNSPPPVPPVPNVPPVYGSAPYPPPPVPNVPPTSPQGSGAPAATQQQQSTATKIFDRTVKFVLFWVINCVTGFAPLIVAGAAWIVLAAFTVTGAALILGGVVGFIVSLGTMFSGGFGAGLSQLGISVFVTGLGILLAFVCVRLIKLYAGFIAKCVKSLWE